MIGLLCFVLAVLTSPFKSRLRLEAENAALRYQLMVFRRRLRGRVRLTNHDRWFFIQLYRWFPSILSVLTIVRLETSPERVVQHGVVQVAEGRQLFPALTIAENLLMGAFTRKQRSEIQKSLDRVYELFPILRERRGEAAQSLSGGQQQMLAIGRALMAAPRMMIFDEPSLGLAPIAIEQIFKVIQDLNREGMPILLIEQNVSWSCPRKWCSSVEQSRPDARSHIAP